MSCLGDGPSTEFDKPSTSPTANSLLVAGKRRSGLRKFSVAHSISYDKDECLDGEAQLVKTPQRRAVPVST